MKVHATVSPALPAAELSETICARRWARWRPLATQWLRQHDIEPSVLEVELLRLRHRAHLIACHAAQLPDILVFRHQLDDPRRTDAERDALMQPHIERSETHKSVHRRRKMQDIKEQHESHSK
jgi:hypothetical protein